MHDSVGFIDLYKKLKDRFSTDEIIAIAMDAGYITPYICKELLEDNILPSLSYKCPMTKDGYREYKSNPCECSKCPYLDRCTNSKNRQKVITPHIWQEFVDEASHL